MEKQNTCLDLICCMTILQCVMFPSCVLLESLSGAGKCNGHVGWSGGFNSGLSCGPVGY